MKYREYPPPPVLTPFVRAIWTLHGAAPTPVFDLVLPDGCAELVVHRAGRFREWGAKERSEQPGAVIAGVMDRAVALSPPARVETLGIRLLPHGLAWLCDAGLDDISQGICPADVALRPQVTRLLASAAAANSLDDAVRVLERELPALFGTARVPATVADAVRRLRRTGGRMPIERLLRESGGSFRALERQFDRWVGLSPKRYARVVRFHRAIGRLLSTPDLSGATLAADCGYYDQAHLSRDFKAFTGWAPRALLQGRIGELTHHFAGSPLSDSSKTAPADAADSGESGGSP